MTNVLIEILWAGIYLYINVCIDSYIKESNKRELTIESQACCDKKLKQVFMQCWYMVSIHGLTYLKNIWDIKLLKVLSQGFMELNKKRRHTLMCYILVLHWEACNAWNNVIKSWLQSKTSTSRRKDRNKCSCINWWFLNMACQSKACLV